MANWPGDQSASPRDPRDGSSDDTTHVIPQFQRTRPSHVDQPPWPHTTAGGHPAGWPTPGPVDRVVVGRAGRSRTRQLGIITAAAVLVAAICVGLVAYTGTTGGSSVGPDSATVSAGSAAETVVAYLDALSRGDAAAALSYGKSQPVDSSLLTDDVLRTQIAAMPISDVQVVGESEGQEQGGGTAEVKLTANFGGASSVFTMGLTKVGDEWKVDHAFNELTIADHTAAVGTMSILGKNITQRQTLYIFPGSLELSTSSEYIDVTFASPLPGQTPVTFRPKVEINDKGEAAALEAVANAYAKCEGSKLLAPPGCLTKIADPEVVEGTVLWGKVYLGAVAVTDFNDQRMFATVDGEVTIPISGQLRSGEHFERTASDQLFESVDLKTAPPTLIG